MRLTIDATPEIVLLEGVRCRVWRGRTQGGTPCLLYVARVHVAEEHAGAFAADLEAAPEPELSPEAAEVWRRWAPRV